MCGGELEPYLQSITGAGLDVRPVRQHVERIYDLVFVSLFNTISAVLRVRERVWRERRRRGKGGRFHLPHTHESRAPGAVVAPVETLPPEP